MARPSCSRLARPRSLVSTVNGSPMMTCTRCGYTNFAPRGIARSDPPIPTGHHRHACLGSQERGAVQQRVDRRAVLAFAFGEQHERLTGLERLQTPLERLAVDRATVDRDRTHRGEQLAEPLVLPHRVLAEVAHPADLDPRGDRRVDVAPMHRSQDERTVGKVLLALDGATGVDPQRGADQLPEEPVQDSVPARVATRLGLDARSRWCPDRSCSRSRQHPHDVIDDLLDRHPGRVDDDRARRLDERAVGTRASPCGRAR